MKTFFGSFYLSALSLTAPTLGAPQTTLDLAPVNLNCGGAVVGASGSKVPVELFASFMIAGAVSIMETHVISFSLKGENLTFLPGTVQAGDFQQQIFYCEDQDPNHVEKVAFCVVNIIDPNKIPDRGPLSGTHQGQGIVGAIQSSFSGGGYSFLNGDGTFTFLKFTVEIEVPQAGEAKEARLYFINGLQGPGQPQNNQLETANPPLFLKPGAGLTLGECRFTVQAQPSNQQRPGDCNQDGATDISDAICLLGHLFLGDPTRMACDDGSVHSPGNSTLLNFNGDEDVDLSDAVSLLTWKFLGGPPHVLGEACTSIAGCPDNVAKCSP